MFPSDYIVYRNDRDYHSTGKIRGGGVLIAIKSVFNSVAYSVPDCNLEAVWVGISGAASSHLVLSAVYVPPTSPLPLYEAYFASVECIMDKLPNSRVILMGDYNLPNYTRSFVHCDVEHNHDVIGNEAVSNCLNLLNVRNDFLFVSSNDCENVIYDCSCIYDLIQLNHVRNFNDCILDLVFFQ